MSEIFDYEVLAGQLNTKFALIDAAQPFELELFKVTEPTVSASQTFFSLFFRGSADFMLPQGTYRMKHELLGELMIFLVPTSREEDGGFEYEAVFNLLNAVK
jgi:hypothetical protein